MNINTRDVDWNRPPVLVHAVDGRGQITDDLTAVVEGEMLFTMLDGTTMVVPWAQALQGRPVRVAT